MPLKYSRRTETFSKVIEIISYPLFLILNFRRKFSGASIKKIVIIEPFQLGDIVSLTVLLDPLKERYPESEIFILTKKSNSFVLQDDKRVKATITLDFPWSAHSEKKIKLSQMLTLTQQAWSLRRECLDLGIDCRGDIRSQILLKMIGCRKTLGYTNYLHSNINAYGLLLDSKVKESPYRHRYDWNRYLLTGLNFSEKELFPLPLPSFQYRKESSKLFKENDDLFKLLIHPGSGWEHRQWSFSSWVRLIQKIYNPQKIDIVIIGGPGEHDILDRLKSALSNESVRFAITDFLQLQNVILESDLFLCLDSGPMNLAVSLDKQVLALFGPGDIEKWKPYNNTSTYIQNGGNLPCNPCLQKKCVSPKNPCMGLITVEEVFEKLNLYFKTREILPAPAPPVSIP